MAARTMDAMILMTFSAMKHPESEHLENENREKEANFYSCACSRRHTRALLRKPRLLLLDEATSALVRYLFITDCCVFV